MDALALLCTLYAEGPVTLARLREGGCATIEDVIARDAHDLAPILLATEATAQRFQREARNLHERVGVEGISDVRSGTITSRATGSVRASSRVGSGVPSSSASHGRPPVLDRVLAAWRERDEHDEHGGHLESDAHDDNREHGDDSGDAGFEREEILQPATPARTPASSASRKPDEMRGIPVGAIDGLDAETSVALARAGVRDLRALSLCDTLTIARASGLAWTQLNRLRALARRTPGCARQAADEATGLVAHEVEPALEEKLSPSERPLVESEASDPLGSDTLGLLDREPARSLDREAFRARAPSPQYANRSPEGAGGPFA